MSRDDAQSFAPLGARGKLFTMGISLLAINLTVAPACRAQTTSPSTQPASASSTIQTVREATKAGMIAYKLTVPEELQRLLGAPQSETQNKDGEVQTLVQHYPGVKAVFMKPQDNALPFVLTHLTAGWREVDIGRNRVIVLRNEGDLGKFDSFWGLANASLVKLDLRQHRARLDQLPFDSRTVWPPADRLPEGFDPLKLLEDGKNPGLGLRGLHRQGIDGKGIHIAIIDQPLLLKHQEYKDRIKSYEPIGVGAVPPQMHGPPVVSIAVGKTCGVAPGAVVHYYAVPTWSWWNLHCKPYAQVLDKIVEKNKQSDPADRVRVVCISLGMFSEWPDYRLWKEAVERAAAEGILVVSCDPAFLKYGTANRIAGKDAEDPSGWQIGRYWSPGTVLLVPAGERTTASHVGADMYTYWRHGGMSWAAPYLAGLAALAFQVAPEIEPATIVELWRKTAGGKASKPAVVNPVRFIEAVRAGRIQRSGSPGQQSQSEEPSGVGR
ncbi:MAG TPA: S8/S53 family peptidase [Phycisphaerae bacterium]|jgi:subtilisin family serine protease|nr:S8/S53 family peptidase [Phycisphaerae bacterium]HOB75641.1 S8/S53 family peptidase [Phycisphaerae bacterium]HOJ56314.1 S8/S53 family peptidase [Phycisphaerae bacterium]HOL28185.1 S8/S53 family peptidase [Phycisphaerae bacterium]HPP22461.1 S8/S53 family peptidase [Phycisphaerae bacterium]